MLNLVAVLPRLQPRVPSVSIAYNLICSIPEANLLKKWKEMIKHLTIITKEIEWKWMLLNIKEKI